MDRIKVIIFDWDGTVVNTMPIKIKNASAIFSEFYNVNPTDVKESYSKHSGIPRRELFELIAKENIGRGLSVFEYNRLSSEFTLRNISSYKMHKVFDESNREVLEWLSSQGLMLFVSSSAIQSEIHELAESLELNKYFQDIFGSFKDFKKGKAHIDHIRKNYNIKTSEIIFVGDEKADIRLSGRLGVMCIGIVHDKHESLLDIEFADHVINHLVDLKEIINVV